jgi:hypothetical protein
MNIFVFEMIIVSWGRCLTRHSEGSDRLISVLDLFTQLERCCE